MSDFEVFKPPKPKPKPGSLPLKDVGQPPDRQSLAIREAAQSAFPPWHEEPSPEQRKKGKTAFTKLKAARNKVDELATVVRNDAFDDWVRRCLVEAQQPSEWTQSRELYENYVKRAKEYGNNRADKALLRQELATETQWGKMMGSVFTKKRRTKGWYYPIRLKQGV